MKKSEQLYRAIGGIDEKKIMEAEEYEGGVRQSGRLRAVLEIVAIVIVACCFIVFSAVLAKVSGERNPAASSSDTENSSGQAIVTAAPDTAAETRAPSTGAPKINKGAFADLQKICDIVNGSSTFDEIREKIKAEYPEPSDYKKWGNFEQYDYRISGSADSGEFVQVTSRYNAVFYYRTSAGSDTVYSSIWSDEAGGAAAPALTAEMLRENTYSLEEYSNIRDNFTPVYYDQALIAEFLNKIYSHPQTTDMPMKLGDTLPEDVSAYDECEGFGCTLYTDHRYTQAFYGVEAPYTEYELTGYPDCIDGPYRVTRIEICNGETMICGVGADSYDRFEETFRGLGFMVKAERLNDGYTVKREEPVYLRAYVEGLSITLVTPANGSAPRLVLSLWVTNNHRVVF